MQLPDPFCFNDSSLYTLMASNLKSGVSVSDGHMPSVLFRRGSGKVSLTFSGSVVGGRL